MVVVALCDERLMCEGPSGAENHAAVRVPSGRRVSRDLEDLGDSSSETSGTSIVNLLYMSSKTCDYWPSLTVN